MVIALVSGWSGPASRGSRNTPSRFMLQKPGLALAAMSQSAPRLHFFIVSNVLQIYIIEYYLLENKST